MENKPNIIINKPTEKNFSIVFFIFFLICSLLFLEKSYLIAILFSLLSILILFLGIYFPHFLKLPNKMWFYFGIFLGRFISPLIMASIYFLILFPTSILSKIFGKNSLNVKFENTKKSYWIMRKSPIQPFKDQF